MAAGRFGKSRKKRVVSSSKVRESTFRQFSISNNVAVISVLAILAIIALFLNYNRVVVCALPNEGGISQIDQETGVLPNLAGQATEGNAPETATLSPSESSAEKGACISRKTLPSSWRVLDTIVPIFLIMPVNIRIRSRV